MFKKAIKVKVAKSDMILMIEILYDHGVEINEDFEIHDGEIILDCIGTNGQFNAAKKEIEQLNARKLKLRNGDVVTF